MYHTTNETTPPLRDTNTNETTLPLRDTNDDEVSRSGDHAMVARQPMMRSGDETTNDTR